MAIIKFPEYTPDLPAFENQGMTVAKNVIPGGDSYLSFPSLTNYSNALTARCQGFVFCKDSGGNSLNFAGDATKLYKLASASYSDVSKVGGYTTASDGRWFFTQFNELLLATNFIDPIQYYDFSSSSAFANLSATAPQARFITNMQNFVVVGNTFDTSDGNVPNRVRWCALDDPTDWTVSAATQADFNDLDSSKGWVQQVVGGEYGVIFQETAISRMDYAGSPLIFQFREVENAKGTRAPASVIKVGNYVYYFGIDGFYVFDGQQSIAIGEKKIDKTVLADLDTTYYDRVNAAVDYTKQIIYWAYPGSGNTNGRPNKILAFNYAPNSRLRWSYAEIDTEVIGSLYTEGYTMDSLDSLSGSLDALTISLDSRYYTGNNLLLAAFDTNHKLSFFSGAALTAILDTGEFQISPGQRTNLLRVKPIVDDSSFSASISMQIGTRNLLNELASFGAEITPVLTNRDIPCRANAFYHKVRVNIAGGFKHAQGIEILEAKSAGKR